MHSTPSDPARPNSPYPCPLTAPGPLPPAPSPPPPAPYRRLTALQAEVQPMPQHPIHSP